MVLSISAGIKLYRQKKYEKALRIFRRMAKRKSDDPEAHALVGMALHKLGRQFEALDACHEAQALADVAVRTHCAEINAAREMGAGRPGRRCHRQGGKRVRLHDQGGLREGKGT